MLSTAMLQSFERRKNDTFSSPTRENLEEKPGLATPFGGSSPEKEI